MNENTQRTKHNFLSQHFYHALTCKWFVGLQYVQQRLYEPSFPPKVYQEIKVHHAPRRSRCLTSLFILWRLMKTLINKNTTFKKANEIDLCDLWKPLFRKFYFHAVNCCMHTEYRFAFAVILEIFRVIANRGLIWSQDSSKEGNTFLFFTRLFSTFLSYFINLHTILFKIEEYYVNFILYSLSSSVIERFFIHEKQA